MTLVDIMRKYKIDKVGYGMQPKKNIPAKLQDSPGKTKCRAWRNPVTGRVLISVFIFSINKLKSNTLNTSTPSFSLICVIFITFLKYLCISLKGRHKTDSKQPFYSLLLQIIYPPFHSFGSSLN